MLKVYSVGIQSSTLGIVRWIQRPVLIGGVFENDQASILKEIGVAV
jgi:hypothetical protein